MSDDDSDRISDDPLPELSSLFDNLIKQANDDNIHLLWNDHFDETQRPLSENLFQLGSFLQRKAKWITANEMAVSGLKDILKSFPFSNKAEPKH